MSDVINRNTVTWVKEEIVEGTYVGPASGNDAVQGLADGVEISPSKELVERSIQTGGLGKASGRPGGRSVSGTIPVEFRSGTTDGAQPEYGMLLEAALGAKRTATQTTASTSDGSAGDDETVPLANIDKTKYSVNDIVRIRRSGEDDHIARVYAVNTTDGSASIKVEPALEYGDSFGAGDVVSAVVTYIPANSGHKSLSITNEMEGAVQDRAIGCHVTSASLENFSTGQIASWNFGFEGLNWDRVIASSGHTPNYDTTLPPLALKAAVYLNGAPIEASEVSVSIENELGFKQPLSSEFGRTSGRKTQRTVTGSFNPYQQTDDISTFNLFKNNTKFDLMLWAFNPNGTQKNNVCAIYIPDCIVTEMGAADQDGIMQDAVSFEADNSNIFISFI